MSTVKTDHIRSAGVVIHDNKMILMKRIRDGYHYFSLPGGKLEPGETTEQACQRELMEECSVNVKIKKKLFEVADQRGEKNVLNVVYLCEYVDGIVELSASEKLANTEQNYYEPMWIDIKDLKNLHYRAEWLKIYMNEIGQ